MMRPFLCHDVRTVWLKRKEDRTAQVMDQQQADALTTNVSRRCQRLESALALVRIAVTAPRIAAEATNG